MYIDYIGYISSKEAGCFFCRRHVSLPFSPHGFGDPQEKREASIWQVRLLGLTLHRRR